MTRLGYGQVLVKMAKMAKNAISTILSAKMVAKKVNILKFRVESIDHDYYYNKGHDHDHDHYNDHNLWISQPF